MHLLVAVVAVLLFIFDSVVAKYGSGKPVHQVFCQIWLYARLVKPTKQQINDALAAEIKAGLARRDMSVRELAQRTGISFSTMLRITNGADLQVSKLYLIADVLQLNPVKLVEAAVTEAERRHGK